jgi:hypothetical protein
MYLTIYSQTLIKYLLQQLRILAQVKRIFNFNQGSLELFFERETLNHIGSLEHLQEFGIFCLSKHGVW